MQHSLRHLRQPRVALLAEGVDRNIIGVDYIWDAINVALLAEGVDRNNAMEKQLSTPQVALLAEGVDRNYVKEAE